MGVILVVDDNRDICEIVDFMLTDDGHEVLVAHSGPEALQTCERVTPDLVLLDVSLPVMSGLEVLGELRARPATSAVPVVMVTARAHPDDVAAGRAAGAQDYVVKPFSVETLLATVSMHLA